MSSIEPHRLGFDPRGAPFSAHYDDVYASRDGALGQARHVFLAGNRLPARWAGLAQFVIVETGFGLGTNFLATWQAWRDDPRRPQRLHFVSVEKHPLPAADLCRQAPAPLAQLAAQLAAAWPPPLGGMHRCEFEAGRVVLTLAFGDARAIVPQLVLGADAFYLDGFAPARNPQLWEPQLLRALARLARPGATLATYSAARAVREALAASGFDLELQPGFGRKREMLVARYAPRWQTRRHEPPAAHRGERRAMVVGAGLAGAACAYALARSGWQVTVCERAPRVAAGASGLPVGLLHPSLSTDDNRAARLSRAGFLLALQRLGVLDPAATHLWAQCGVLQQLPRDEAAEAWRAALSRLDPGGLLVELCSVAAGTSAVGLAPRRAGLWFGRGAVAAPARWCGAMLADAGAAITVLTSFEVDRATYADGLWTLRSAAGVRCAAPLLILANGLDASRLLDEAGLPLTGLRGRVSLYTGEASGVPRLRAAVCGDGYVVPALGDLPGAIGATYESAAELTATASVSASAVPGAPALPSDAAAHAQNLSRLQRLLAAAPVPTGVAAMFDAVRCVARDRMPLAGPFALADRDLEPAVVRRGPHLADLARRPGAFGLLALGSRGLTLAPLLGELVAAQINGEPWPIEKDLAAAVDPARFQLRRLRR